MYDFDERKKHYAAQSTSSLHYAREDINKTLDLWQGHEYFDRKAAFYRDELATIAEILRERETREKRDKCALMRKLCELVDDGRAYFEDADELFHEIRDVRTEIVGGKTSYIFTMREEDE